MVAYSLAHLAAALALAPLLLGVISRVKARFAGRQGAPLLQPYYDLRKLLGKGAVYSTTAGWVFRAGPVVGLAAVLLALLFTPLAGVPGVVSFAGDALLMAYLLGVARFFTVIAAMDTGSPFEGMGASREVQFSALSEPGFLLGALVLMIQSGHLSLSGSLAHLSLDLSPVRLLLVVVFFIVLLAENSRIPVDDPTTHLELTMIHEVMVLDHGGPDLAIIEYAAALKLWLFSALVVSVAIPALEGALGLALGVAAVFAVAVAVGVIESTTPRLRMNRVPQLLVVSAILAAVALFLVML